MYHHQTCDVKTMCYIVSISHSLHWHYIKTALHSSFNAKPIKMLSFSSVAEAYRPDPPSPEGVNFFLTEYVIIESKTENAEATATHQ